MQVSQQREGTPQRTHDNTQRGGSRLHHLLGPEAVGPSHKSTRTGAAVLLSLAHLHPHSMNERGQKPLVELE